MYTYDVKTQTKDELGVVYNCTIYGNVPRDFFPDYSISQILDILWYKLVTSVSSLMRI